MHIIQCKPVQLLCKTPVPQFNSRSSVHEGTMLTVSLQLECSAMLRKNLTFEDDRMGNITLQHNKPHLFLQY
ncbi:hypothetical protein AOLI_G00150670 [Acnodon oligacanthus]